MKIWIHIDGAQEGPYTLEELPLDRMTDQTPVWYDGLSDWTVAGKAPATAHLFQLKNDSFSEEKESHQNEYVELKPEQVRSQSKEVKKCPPTFFAWSIILTLICCNPVGIIPIVTGFYTRSRWHNQNFESARKLSNITEWWVMITIVTSLMLAPLSLLLRG